MRIIFLGPPGSGKGTYASRLSPTLGIPHISTGDIFREEAKRDTSLGRKVAGYMSRGELVPDSITVEVLRERIGRSDCLNGFILDGYPRTIKQAVELDKVATVDVVILLNMPEDILIEKLSARRVCTRCGEIYNIADIRRTIAGQTFELPAMLPRVPETCDKCGGNLIQRKDDTVEVIRNRLQVYQVQTEPLVRYYRDKGLIVDINVTSGPNVMVPRIRQQLDKRAKMMQLKS